MWIKAFIGLGSNLNDPIQQLTSALTAIEALPNCRSLRYSRMYRTPPIGPQNQPDYINAVAELDTKLSPLTLLEQILQIEQQHGRIRNGIHWEARTLDLDLLLYGNIFLKHPQLSLPHPHMHQRGFVLMPLQDIVGQNFWVPGAGYISTLLKTCDCTGIEAILP